MTVDTYLSASRLKKLCASLHSDAVDRTSILARRKSHGRQQKTGYLNVMKLGREKSGRRDVLMQSARVSELQTGVGR